MRSATSFWNHARAAGNQVLVVEHLEEYLWKCCRDSCRSAQKAVRRKVAGGPFQEILLDDMVS